MGMPHATHDWTAEMVRALPDDGKRYEVVGGELLVTPAPRLAHQRAVMELWRLIADYVSDRALGEALVSPADIEFAAHTMVQPDVFVAPLVAGHRPRDWSEIEGLLLAVEVLSPSTARADRQVKRWLYQRQGVGEYWIVDLDARLVERWRPQDERPELVAERLAWRPASSGESLEIDLSEFFERVSGSTVVRYDDPTQPVGEEDRETLE